MTQEIKINGKRKRGEGEVRLIANLNDRKLHTGPHSIIYISGSQHRYRCNAPRFPHAVAIHSQTVSYPVSARMDIGENVAWSLIVFLP